MVRRYNHRSSTYKDSPSLRTLKISSFVFLILTLIVGSQEILNSYPTDVFISNTTKFGSSFDSIDTNQVTISGRTIQISEGDVVKLDTGGYLKFKALQTPSDYRESYKYNSFKLNQILLFSQTIYEWNYSSFNPITIETNNPSQTINLYYFSYPSDKIRINTYLSTYNIVGNQTSFISTDDNEILYQLVSEGDNKIKINAIGIYNYIQYKISASEITS